MFTFTISMFTEFNSLRRSRRGFGPQIFNLPTRACLLALVFMGITGPLQAQNKTAAQDAGTQLDELVEREWQMRQHEFPLLATRMASRQGIDRLAGQSIADENRRAEATRGFLTELRKINAESLTDEHRVTYQVFEWVLEERLAEHELGGYRFPMSAESGFHTGLARLALEVPLASVEDYEAYLARLEALPRVFDDYIGVLNYAIETGWTLPAVTLEGFDLTIESLVVQKPDQSLLFQPFQEWPVGVPEAARGDLEARGRQAVMKAVNEGFGSFLNFFREAYLPSARETLGASEMPNGGAEYYANRLRHYTTLDMSADEVHQLGLKEVARIRAEMDQIIEQVGFEGSFAEFLSFLRTDPQFYAKTPRQLLERAAYLSKKIDAQLPALFGFLPRQPYGVEPVPDYLAPKYTAGRYVGAPLNSTRGGTYWVNTYALETRPLYALEALTLHEAVPGHHLQSALAAELDLPPFRRNLYISAFGEGWGLYSERLGLEAGFYEDPYSDFGRLTYEMWRACRLVVDTGIHAKGWTREQAVDYLASNTALSLHEVNTEIDRYISWPGQALSYKIGELEIRRLRKLAEDELGIAFDLRAFHDRVLGQGSLPLKVLRSEIVRWIDDQKRSSAGESEGS